jgi:phage shock protein E
MNANQSMLMRASLCLATALCLCAGSAADKRAPTPGKNQIKHVDATQAGKLVADKKVVVLDIRTPEEFKGGHIGGATNINFGASDFEQQVAKLDKSKAYLVHCASGGRSSQSLSLLQKLKFESLYHLDGGLKSWEKAGLPVQK